MVNKINKRGDYKYGIILSLILGVMVLSLSLYFIFQELWSDDELDWEICRQSIQIRSLLPDTTIKGVAVHSFKDSYPLKCKTQVVNIEKNDVRDIKDAQKIIAETMARCWALYDKGDAGIFPSKFYFDKAVCVSCARIHLTEEAKKELGNRNINIKSALDLPMTKDYSYYEYLNNSGKKFPAFNIGSSWSFNLKGNVFSLDKDWWEVIKMKDKSLVNRLSGAHYKAWMINGISLPETFYPERGDLIINYGAMIVRDVLGNKGFGTYVPYLFYFQANQKTPDPFDEMTNIIFKGESFGDNVALCNEWEGIPA